MIFAETYFLFLENFSNAPWSATSLMVSFLAGCAEFLAASVTVVDGV
jgi:hypothetical protein